MSSEKSVITKFTTLYVDPIVMKRIMYYTQAAEGEVSGLGVITKDEKGRHIVSSVYLLEQEASAADTELKPEAISGLMVTMLKENKDPGTLKFWWHSHASMGVFWSGTDDTCAETLSKEFAFSLVVNKAGEKRCRLDLYTPFRITFDGVRVEELTQEDVHLKEECEKEVKEKVKAPYESWRKWDDRDYCGGYYQGGFGKHSYRSSTVFPAADSKVKLPETIVEDIKRIMDIAARNADGGGVLCLDTWNEYIVETLREVVEKKFDKKAGCNSFATFDKEFPACMRDCKTVKQCELWTKFFRDAEPDMATSSGGTISDITVE